LWKLRNRACFEKKLIKSPSEISCYGCSFLRYWSGLHKEEDKEIILAMCWDFAGKDADDASTREKSKAPDNHGRI
jgi:hypothetical protein